MIPRSSKPLVIALAELKAEGAEVRRSVRMATLSPDVPVALRFEGRAA